MPKQCHRGPFSLAQSEAATLQPGSGDKERGGPAETPGRKGGGGGGGEGRGIARG